MLHALQFADGQGQLWPLRVLASHEKLCKPLKSAGYAVVVEPLAATSPSGLAADALCVLVQDSASLSEVASQVDRIRSDGMVVLCSLSGRVPRELLTATLLHAGLVDVTQIRAGRYLLTAGRVLPRLATDRGPRHRIEEQPEQ